MSFNFIASPRLGRLEQITRWLKDERTATDSGFYCNISDINKAFADKEFFCATLNNEAIAFATFTKHKNTARIKFAEVHPSHRGTGVGRFLVENSLKTFAKRKVYVVDLQCEPRVSETFWRHLGFYNTPDGIDENYYLPNSKPIIMYRPTGTTQDEVPFETSENVIELFDCKPWECTGRQPKWCWPLVTENEKDILVKPIIHPANAEWLIRWRVQDNVVKESVVKYFCRESYQLGKWIILEKPPQVP